MCRLRYLIASTACLFVSSALANDIPVVEPEPFEYMRVCDAYGKGYFYIPGTQTCMRIGGRVFGTFFGGDEVYARSKSERNPKKWRQNARAELNFLTAQETEYGTLRTVLIIRSQWANGEDRESGNVRFGYIELGGLRVGLDESALNTWFDYYGNFINDDVIAAGGYRTNLISYTYTADNGFSTVVSFEQGGGNDADYNYQIKNYMPHTVLGVKYEQGWGYLAGAAAYDAVNSVWIGKAKVSLKLTDKFNIWGMAAYKNMGDSYYLDIDDLSTRIANSTNTRGIRAVDSFYGTWGGKWVGWVGASFDFSEKTTGNFELAYEGAGNTYSAANLNYEVVEGLSLIPEVNYHKWNDNKSELKGKDAIGGALRLQRKF